MAKEPRLVPHELEHNEDGSLRVVRFLLPEVWQRRYGLQEDAEIVFLQAPRFEMRYHRVGRDRLPVGDVMGMFSETACDHRLYRQTVEDPGRTLEWRIRSEHRWRLKQKREGKPY